MLYITNKPVLYLKEGEQFIITARQITVEEAKDILNKWYYTSVIDDKTVAEFLTKILGMEIIYNPIEFELEPEDRVIAFVPKQWKNVRTAEELERIGYMLWLFIIYQRDDPSPCVI
jgi:hypothetical protein